jgi:hypothetical protein
MSLIIAYLIVGLITALGLMLEHYYQERRKFAASDTLAIPAATIIIGLAWLPLYAWAFCGPNRHRMEWNT